MRIAYLCADFGVRPLGRSGASAHLQETVRALRALGHEVEVYSASPDADRPEAPAQGIHYVGLEGGAAEAARLLREEQTGLPDHLAREWQRLVYAEHCQRALHEPLCELAPDIIYERYSLFSYGGIEIARRLGIPHILEVNAPLSYEAATYRELVLRSTAEALERRILTRTDALIVVSHALADFARGLGVADERIMVLPNGVDPDQFSPVVSGARVRESHGLSDRMVIGFVGTLKPWHDLDTLARAIEVLADDKPEVHLLVVGDGPGRDRLGRLEEGRLTCTGAVAYEEVPQFMAAMDVIVVPYGKDGDCYFSPLKLFEAMAMAKPVVGARRGEVAYTLTDGCTGLLYEPGDADDLARKIALAVDGPAGPRALGDAARRAVLDERTWEHNARRTADLALSLTQPTRSSRWA